MRAKSIVGTWITLSLRSVLPARPSLSRNDTWNGLGTDVRDDLPNRTGRHHPAVGRHPFRTTIEDRLKQRAIGAAVAPAAVHQARPHPSRRATAVATVAVHRAEDLGAV